MIRIVARMKSELQEYFQGKRQPMADIDYATIDNPKAVQAVGGRRLGSIQFLLLVTGTLG